MLPCCLYLGIPLSLTCMMYNTQGDGNGGGNGVSDVVEYVEGVCVALVVSAASHEFVLCVPQGGDNNGGVR